MKVLVGVLFVSVGCKGSAVGIAGLGPDALVEKFENANVGWSIDGDGHVHAAVEGPDGKPFVKDVTGTLVYKTSDGAPKTVPLVLDAKSGALLATGPKLDAPVAPP